jgi:uncharacterized membrane protein YsdA (DUF1294 family)
MMKECILSVLAICLIPLVFIYSVGFLIYLIDKMVNKKKKYRKLRSYYED